nr:MAG TPA: hypothetical protein [Caudoviricetes sp.]
MKIRLVEVNVNNSYHKLAYVYDIHENDFHYQITVFANNAHQAYSDLCRICSRLTDKVITIDE